MFQKKRLNGNVINRGMLLEIYQNLRYSYLKGCKTEVEGSTMYGPPVTILVLVNSEPTGYLSLTRAQKNPRNDEKQQPQTVYSSDFFTLKM